MKGQAELLSHTILLAITISILIFVVHSMDSIKDDYADFISDLEAKQVCFQIKNAVMRLETPVIDQTKQETIGYIHTNLPDKIGDSYYRVTTSGKNITLNIFSNENYECHVGFDFTGQTIGGKTKISRIVDASENVLYQIEKA